MQRARVHPSRFQRQGDKILMDNDSDSAHMPAVNDANREDELTLVFHTLPWFRFSKPKNAICCDDQGSCVKILIKTRSTALGRGDTYIKASQVQDPILNG